MKSKINNYLSMNDNQTDVNFLKLISLSEVNKLSITCKYLINNNYYYLTLNNDCTDKSKKYILNNGIDSDNYYYGLHPRIDSSLIINAIKYKSFLTKESFMSFSDKYVSNFILDIPDVNTLLSLYRKTLLQSASNFGIPFYIENNLFKSFNKDIDGKLDKGIDYNIIQTKNETILYILGSITHNKLKILDELGFRYIIKDNNIYFNKTYGSLFIDLYNDDICLNKIHPIGIFYYSGVLPRLKSIETRNKQSYNQTLDIMILYFERTTYFTVNMMDNPLINSHSFLIDELKFILEFEKKEDKLLSNTLFKNDEMTIDIVNEYLKESSFTNIVAVTGNISTKDNYYLLAQRSSRSIDSTSLYPSVNGQSEIYDSNVPFYNESVYEDTPSLMSDESIRLDYNNELNRECNAELYITKFEKDWSYYGVSILGINNSKNENIKKRRLHFSILAYNQASDNLLEISKNINNATEREENSTIYAVKIKIYSNYWKLMLSLVDTIARTIAKWKSLLVAPLSIILFIQNIRIILKDGLSNIFSLTNFNSLLSFIILVFVIFISFSDLRKIIKNYNLIRRSKRNIKIIGKVSLTNKSNSLINKIKSKIKNDENKSIPIHPITKLMLLLHLYRGHKND